MVDAEDLKSFGYCNRVGSSPTIPTKKRRMCDFFGCVAQLVRALRSHRRGRWFESNHIHQNKRNAPYRAFFIINFYRRPLARQHADAALRQSEYCLPGLRRSVHGCQPVQFLFVPVPLHFAYLRNEHV